MLSAHKSDDVMVSVDSTSSLYLIVQSYERRGDMTPDEKGDPGVPFSSLSPERLHTLPN